MSDDAVRTLARARGRLLAERVGLGRWTGELSSSALSTATAGFALHRTGGDAHAALAGRAADWLAEHANADGGWGDTADSPSNLAATLLGCAALRAIAPSRHAGAVDAAGQWLARTAGGLDADSLAAAVAGRYGDDRTFSAPILTMCALSGMLGDSPDAWRLVPAMPFELALLPQSLLRFVRLPVVSYALPALIGIGLARHVHRPPACPVKRIARRLAVGPALGVLDRIQPPSGGFLEAAPLTAFVTMSLESVGLSEHRVTRRAMGFLAQTVRSDGSWPIDTNLATWVTSLATRALAESPGGLPDDGSRAAIAEWLLGCRHRRRHPYTGADAGGWAWTDLPGGVPDADDTAAGMMALRRTAPDDPRAAAASGKAAEWLVGLQNPDGGIPTFCRGWNALPFDRSCADLTAHALEAWSAWRDDLPAELSRRVGAAMRRAVRFLAGAQRRDGAWVPLWFGNQHAPGEQNPTYGTARVVSALVDARQGAPGVTGVIRRGVGWLLAAQQDDGGWGGDRGVPPSIEETAVAVHALAAVAERRDVTCGLTDRAQLDASIRRGVGWLVEHTQGGTDFPAAPIGLYFARLWYREKLYPMVFTAAALGRAVRCGALERA